MAADLPLTWAFNPRLFPTLRVMFRTGRKSLNLTASFGRRLSESDTDQWWSHDGSKEGTDAAGGQAARVTSTMVAQCSCGLPHPLPRLMHLCPRTSANGARSDFGLPSRVKLSH